MDPLAPKDMSLMKPVYALAVLLLATAGLTAQAAPSPQATSFKGEVLETRSVEGYTYLRLETAQGEIWAAVPTTAAKTGAQVTIGDSTVMRNFQSKALQRTFDKIVFGQIVEAGAKPTVARGTTPLGAASGPTPKVAKATGPDSKTVAEVVTGKATLKDKTVLVRGKVVRISRGILGKNWVHLQDGSGSAVDGSNDILVTTKDDAALGDIVTAKGTVRTDVTVGPGYTYAVLIEDAAVSK